MPPGLALSVLKKRYTNNTSYPIVIYNRTFTAKPHVTFDCAVLNLFTILLNN